MGPERTHGKSPEEHSRIVREGYDKIAEDYIRSKNAIPAFKGYSQGNSPGFPGNICTSIDDEVVHGIPGDRKLNDGEILSVDVGVLKNGYYGDAALSIAVGELSSNKKKLMEITEKSLYKGIEQAIVSNRIGDISEAIQNEVESNSFSVVRELCGHGVGKYLHEEPQVMNFGKKGTGIKLKNGMTIAIEPMVNMGVYNVIVAEDKWTVKTADGLPSAHFEHTILITNGNPEILTIT